MSNELSFNELSKLFKRKWKMILGIAILCSLIGGFISYKTPPTYEARTDLLVNYTVDSDESTTLQSNDIEISLRLIETYKQILKSDRMYEKVISVLEAPYKKSDLRDNILIETDGNSQIITISGQEKTAEQAALLVNTYAILFQEEIKTLMNLENINILNEISSDTDIKEVKLPMALFISMFFIISLFLTVTILLIQEFYFTKLNTITKTESILKVPNVGSVPTIRSKRLSRGKRNNWNEKLITTMPAPSLILEEFRRIRANVQFLMSQKSVKTILITSPIFGDGKSLVSGNLAIVMAMDGKKTIFVDADLRGTNGREMFNLPMRKGLTSVISGYDDLDQIIQSTEIDNLSFISSGPVPPNPAEILSSDKMKLLIGKLKLKFDVIIIDAPPLVVADTVSLSTVVDGCLYVIDAERTNGELANMKLDQLRKVEATILGTVLNKGQSLKKDIA